MEAHPRNLKSVFRADVRLTVPLFQRPYVWTADDQWQPLWEDILATRDRMAHGDTTPHFLGAVVLMLRPSALGSLEVREVIDGQQRLTTLQLLITAVRDTFASVSYIGKGYRRLARLVANDEDLVDGPDEVYKLWPTNRDRDTYRRVLRGEFRDVAYAPALERIAGAYTWFTAAVQELIASDPATAEDVLDSLAEVLLEALEMVVIDLGENDNAQIIFETLNARGTPLRAADLIKNLTFRTLQDAQLPVDKMYEEFWETFESKEWEQDVRIGRLVRNRLDTYMGFFLVVFLTREVHAHQLFPAARSWIGADAQRAEEFLREVARYAQIYGQIDSRTLPSAKESAVLERMRAVDTTTMTPLLLWIIGNTEGDERLRALQALESYIVRRSLCRLTTKNYNRLFLELLKRLVAGETPVDQVVTTFLDSQTSDSGMWPSDAELVRAFVTLPLYKQLKRESLQIVLRALERHATTNRNEVISARAKLSIEHLMPQKWPEHWPLDGTTEDPEAEAEGRNAVVHTIGNLTLITPWLNSGLSNRPWSAKRRDILAHSALSLNRSLPNTWGVDSIRSRSHWLASIAADLWPRPSLAEGRSEFAEVGERDLRPDRDYEMAAAKPSTVQQAKTRRDIGAHIVHAFRDLPSGTFLTIQQIRNTPSPEYGNEAPSAGAISARLFPSTGSRTTVPDVVAERENGVRGARKL